MSPPAAAEGRTALGRLVDRLRRRLSPDRRVPPATVPGLGSGEETALSAAARPAADADAQRAADAGADPGADAAEVAAQRDGADADADARFDAARERLRAQIEPPEPPDDD